MTNKINKRAVLVGINYINSGYRLYGCANDQEEMYQLLRLNGYDRDNILFLSDESNMSNGKPTSEMIMKGIRWLLTGSSVKDFDKDEKAWAALNAQQLFFGYSGHGSYIRDNSGTETDGRDEVLVPLDYITARTVIADDTLRKELINKVPKDVKLTSIIDCCHSGTMLDLRWKVSTLGSPTKDLILTYNPKREETDSDIIMLSGCLDSETAAENYHKRKAMGLLTSVFVEYMEKVKYKTTCSDLLKHINQTMQGQHSLLTLGKNRSLYTEFNL